MHLHPKQALVAGSIAGFIAAVPVFAFCCLGAAVSATTEGSFGHGFYPWYRWSNLEAALVVFAAMGVVVGILALFRPNVVVKKKQEPTSPGNPS